MPRGFFEINTDLYTLTISGAFGETPVSIALPMVNRVEYSRSTSAVPQWTLGKRDVYIHHSGVKAEQIVIYGRSGQEIRLGSGRRGDTKLASGPELFQELEDFLLDYESVRGFQKTVQEIYPAAAPAPVVPIKLAFRAMNEDKNFFVEPLSFSWNRDARTSRFGYTYKLELLAYAPFVFHEFSYLARLRSDLGEVNTLFNNFAIWGERLSLDVAEIRGAYNSLYGPLNSLRRGLRAWEGFFRDSFGLVNNIPARVIHEVAGSASDFLRLFHRISSDVPFGLSKGSGVSLKFHLALQAVQDARLAAIKFLFYRNEKLPPPASGNPTGGDSHGNKATATGGDSGSEIMTQAGGASSFGDSEPLYAIAMMDGESIKDFALRTTGNHKNWQKIALINDLMGGKKFANGQPLLAGTKLLVPMPQSVGGGANVDGTAQYGIDLLLDPQGDLRIIGGKEYGVIRGTENLRQAITNRLLTTAGEVRTAPTMGIPKIIGKRQTAKAVGTVIFATETQILSDSRVREISEFSFKEGAGVVEINATVEPYGGSSFDVVTDVEVSS